MIPSLFELRPVTVSVLEPHIAAIRSLADESFAEWRQVVGAASGPLRGRTRADYFYDAFNNRLVAYFEEQGVRAVPRGQHVQFVFEDERIVLRVKKYRNAKQKLSGAKTNRQRIIEGQQDSFEGMEVYTLVLGWLPDSAGMELEMVAVSCHYRGDLLWSIPLPPAEAVELPSTTTDPIVPPAIRPRKSTRRERAVGDEEE